MSLRIRVLVLALACLSSSAPAFAQLPANMRSYFVAILKKGPAWTADPATGADGLRRDHLAYRQRLEAEKKLLGAGDVTDNSELGAVLVLDVPSKADAERVVAEDPAVKANTLTPLVLEWFAEKGVGQAYLERRLAKPGEPIPVVPYQFGFLVRGPNTAERTKERAAEVQKGHMANLEAMHAAGLLVAAGPFGDGGDYRGIVVFKAQAWDQVFDAIERDPAIRTGRLALRLYRCGFPAGVFAK
jgi:uncharacterized protein YciI